MYQALKMVNTFLALFGLVFISSCSENNWESGEESASKNIRFNEVMSNNLNYSTDDTFFEYADWIELSNTSENQIDISGYTLSDKRDNKGWKIPLGTIISQGGYQIFWADGKNNRNHTDFRIKNKGENLFLFNSEGVIIDSIYLVNQIANVSYGIGENGTAGYFQIPSPNKRNNNAVPKVEVSAPIFKAGPQLVKPGHNFSMSPPKEGLIIRYTVDCSEPSLSSPIYEVPIQIKKTTIVRAKCFDENGFPSPTVTQSFIVQRKTSLPIMSLVTDPINLWDDYVGIYVEGKNGVAGQIGPVANWNRDWERPANVEFFDGPETAQINIGAGIKILGLYISAWPQKPFGIYFRKSYGKPEANYQFFEDRAFNKYSHLVIRVADWNDTGMRDGMMTSLVSETMEIDYQAYRPVATYLNGEFWGIYNLREKQNENYLMLNHGVDPKELDLIEYKIGELNVIEGTGDDYTAMLEFCRNNSLADVNNYKVIADQIDLDNYLDYYIAELFFANSDWPGNNLKCWKSQKEGSKWRWILYDLDNGFDFYHRGFIQFNSLNHALTASGDPHHNPEHSTLLFRSLMGNSDFAQLFIQRMAVHLNNSFTPKRISNIVDSIAGNVRPLIDEHVERWKDSPKLPGGYVNFKSVDQWEYNVNYLKKFANERNPYMWKMVMGTFQITETINISLERVVGGYCSLAGVEVKKNYSGKHFKNVPFIVKAISIDGYEFVGWKGDARKEANIQIVPSQNISLTPIFRKTS